MRSSEEIPWWLRDDLEIIGFEDEEDEDEEEDETEEEEDESEEDEDEDSDDEDEDDEEDEEEDDKSKSKKGAKGKKKPNNAALLSALRKERIKNRNLERRLRRLEAKDPPKKKAAPPKKAGDKKEEEEEDTSQADAERTEREQRLAKKFRDTAINNLVIKHAGDFQSVDEALALIDRKEIEVDQDDDDPSEIEVDEESVIEAVKALAKKSPHLLRPKGERRSRSGSKFNGRRKKSNEPSEEEVRKKYSALQH